MPRGRGVRRARQQHPYGGVGRGQPQGQQNRRGHVQQPQQQEAERRPNRRRNQPPQQEVVEAVQPPQDVAVNQAVHQDQHRPEAQLAATPTCNVAIQADNNVINGEDFVASTINNDPLLVPMSNEIDIFVSQNLKEKIWNLQYINLVLLLPQNFDVPNEPKVNGLTVKNGNMLLTQKIKI